MKKEGEKNSADKSAKLMGKNEVISCLLPSQSTGIRTPGRSPCTSRTSSRGSNRVCRCAGPARGNRVWLPPWRRWSLSAWSRRAYWSPAHPPRPTSLPGVATMAKWHKISNFHSISIGKNGKKIWMRKNIYQGEKRGNDRRSFRLFPFQWDFHHDAVPAAKHNQKNTNQRSSHAIFNPKTSKDHRKSKWSPILFH